MFGLFSKKTKVKKDESCKIIKACTLTDTIIARVNIFFDKYYQQTGTKIIIKFSDDESLIHSKNVFDMPFSLCKEPIRTDLDNWIQEYQSSPSVTSLPYELDRHCKELLAGYECDDSYECLFDDIRESCTQSNQEIGIVFTVSPWSNMIECEDCIRIFW